MSYTENQDKEQVDNTNNRSPVTALFNKFADHKDVKLIYGEPITFEKQCIVPVAKINYSFGAGGGKGSSTSEDDDFQDQGEGEGGGGIISVKPLGVYKMSSSHVRFKPVIDLKFLGAMITILTLGTVFFLRRK